MKKTLLTLCCATFLALPAYADDTLIIDDGAESIVTGVVKDVQFDEIIMIVGQKEIEVEVDDLDLDNKIEDYFPIGTQIRVIGTLDDDDEMNANKIIRLGDDNADVNLITDVE